MQTESKTSNLSNREREVLQLIAKEMTTSEIADSLGISFGTVETHRKRIRQKLQAKNMAGVIVKAIQKGELEITKVGYEKHH